MRNKLVEFRGTRSQEEMAKKYNVKQQSWSQWERGLSTPRMPIMKQLEIDSGVPMEELFCDVFNKNNLLSDRDKLPKTG